MELRMKQQQKTKTTNSSPFQGSQELVDDRTIDIGINLQLTRVGSGPGPGGVELLIRTGRPIQKKVVQKPPLRSQHGGVHRRRRNRRHVRGNGVLRRSFRVVQTPHIVGDQTLKKLNGFGSPEPDDGPGFQKRRHGAGRPETCLCGEESRGVARIGSKEVERELEATHFGESSHRRWAAARRVLSCGGGGDVFVHGSEEGEGNTLWRCVL